MKKWLFVMGLISADIFASPAPFPVFLKMGFSSVLEFDSAPTRVVLGDSQSFQVERLECSLVVRALAPYGTTNLFVYFREEAPRLFVLTSSEDAEPTFYKRFETQASKPAVPVPQILSESLPKGNSGVRLVSARFDSKKDYLVVEILIRADSQEALKPKWDWTRLTHNHAAISPDRLWAERKEIQKDATVRARFIFTKPNVTRSLSGVGLVIPLHGRSNPLRIALSRRSG